MSSSEPPLKPCFRCKASKPDSAFTKDRKAKSGLSSICKACQSNDRKLKDAAKYMRSFSKPHRRNMRLKAIERLGGKCNCCGETQPEFLTFDHVNNDGAIERKTRDHRTYVTQIANGTMADTSAYQVLCYNCNCAKQYSGLGACPHSIKQE